MKIRKLQLKNGYKRFHDLTIDLGQSPKRIVALVGPNGCGKSSVLDGLLFLANSHNQIGDKGAKNHEYHSMQAAPGYDSQNVLVEFESGGTFQQTYTERQKLGSSNTIFSFRSPYRFNSQLRLTAIQAVPEIRLNNYGASTASDLDDKMERNYRRLYAAFYKYMRDDQSKSMADAKTKIIGDLNDSLSRCLSLQVHDIGNIEGNEGTLYFKKVDHPKPFDFNVLSAGEKGVVDLLLDLYLRQHDYSDTVFMLDEPELHLSTAIQRRLLLEINKLVGPNCQIWIATHSIGFLRALQDDLKADCDVLYFNPEQPFASKSVVLRPMTKTIANWREVFSTALDDLAGLLSPTHIIYCEGRDRPVNGKEAGLDASIYNTIFSNEFHDALFVSSGGNTELDQRSDIALAILGKVFVDIKISVLKDRDSGSGQLFSLSDRETYLATNSGNHRMLKRFEIENYLYDREVLAAYCLKNASTFDDGTYTALIKDIREDNVKDLTGQVKKICGIKGSISKEIFKQRLAEVVTPQMTVYQELKECIFESLAN